MSPSFLIHRDRERERERERQKKEVVVINGEDLLIVFPLF